MAIQYVRQKFWLIMMGRNAVNANILIRLSFISPVYVLYFTNRQPDIGGIPDIHDRGVRRDILRLDF